MKMASIARVLGGASLALSGVQAFIAPVGGRALGVRAFSSTNKLAMTLKEGDKLPMDITFQTLIDGKPTDVGASELFAGKKVVICGVPGAFTPTCNDSHLPSFISNYDALKAKGADTVACLSVNDAFVMGSWIKSLDAADKVTMLSDGGAAFAKATGLAVDTGNFGGLRLNRMSMVVDDGVVTKLNLEDKTGYTDISTGETVLGQL